MQKTLKKLFILSALALSHISNRAQQAMQTMAL